jgi:hypothetical protein
MVRKEIRAMLQPPELKALGGHLAAGDGLAVVMTQSEALMRKETLNRGMNEMIIASKIRRNNDVYLKSKAPEPKRRDFGKDKDIEKQ